MSIFTPIQQFADMVTYRWLGINEGSYFGNSVNFFIYDAIKIGSLLIIINYVMAITRYYFPMEKVRDILTKRNWYGFDYLLAAFLGVVTPFCSCSSIPLFIGFLSAGIPLGVTFAFLISSPLVNESSLYLFPAVFGLKITLLYNLVGIAVSIVGGYLISRLNMDKYVEADFLNFKLKREFQAEFKNEKIPFPVLVKHWSDEALKISKKILPYVFLGVGVGALIHGFVPGNIVLENLSGKPWWSVPVAVAMGVPLYANSIAVVPIIEALVGKGVPTGTAIAFMTATVTLSIPEALMLSRVMKKQLLAAFFAITIVGILMIGYLFNWIV